METDRELLELAAKAAGLHHVDYSGLVYDGKLGLQLTDSIGRHTVSWCPLTDDGDALRLAVMLRLKIYQGELSAIAHPRMSHAYAGESYDENGDAYTATRRAIVRVAAEIGRTLFRKARSHE